MNDGNIKEKIEKCLNTSEKIDKLVKKIYKTVELTKMSATDEFKPYTEPKKNLDDLSTFYDTFIECDDKLKEIGENLEIGNYENIENTVIKRCHILYEIQDKLEEYDKVIIVKNLLKEVENILEPLVKFTEKEFFEKLGLEKDTKKLKTIINFLFEKGDIKSLVSRYLNELYNKKSFDKIKFDRNLLLSETLNIDKTIYDLNQYNTEILDEKYFTNTNLGLNKTLILNLKKVIGENLQVVEREEKLEHVPFLISLNSNLKHTEEKQIKEVETLFEFKDPINKIICNIFITYTDNVERLDKPNKFSDVESLSLDLRRALDSMNSNKIVTKVFIKNYGPMFKINTIEEMNKKFSEMLINRILKLSDSMGELKKCIYLINNLYALQNYISKDLKDKIQECSDSILNTFNTELLKKKKENITGFVDSNIAALKSYYLPDEVRIKVVSLMKKVIWEEIGKKGYEGELETLNLNINEMFMGK